MNFATQTESTITEALAAIYQRGPHARLRAMSRVMPSRRWVLPESAIAGGALIVVPRLGLDVDCQAIAKRIESLRWVGTLIIRLTKTICNFKTGR